MSAQFTVEQRLAALEAAVGELQAPSGAAPAPAHWLEQMRGAFKDDLDFGKVVEYGREIREADRPAESAEEPAA